jgi:Flp pilus assembly pilin Flp
MSVKILEKFYSFLREEHAATAVEYAIMLVLIILVALVAVAALGLATADSFQEFVTRFSSLT